MPAPFIPNPFPFPWNQPPAPPPDPLQAQYNAQGNLVVDPMTGRVISTAGLVEGASPGAAQVARGFAMDTLQEQRRGETLSLLGGVMGNTTQPLLNYAMNELNQGPQDLEELGRLLFAQGSDAASGSALATSRQIASSIGGRGISASSPDAAILAQQAELERHGQVRGTERDVRIALLERTQSEKARLWAQALQANQNQSQVAGMLADVTMMVPEYGFQAQQGLTEATIERAAIARAEKQAKKASKNSLIGSIIGGAASILGSI